jgi:3',5'-cyclic-AMP phosphodiesterase
LQVFAVEDTGAQVCWSDLAPGRFRLRALVDGADVAETVVESTGGPGAADLTDLPAATSFEVSLAGARGQGASTLAPPSGRELCRVASINDLHLGATDFGLFHRLKDDRPSEPHPLRCARAAIRESLAWGAQLLIVKGDLTHNGTPAQWAAIGQLLGGLRVPVAVVPGNHDVRPSREVDPQPELRRHGLHLVHGVEVMDVPGVRILLVDSTEFGHHHGRIAHIQDEIARLVGRAAGPALVAMHHHPQRWRVQPYYPPGIPQPESRRFLEAVEAANPATLVTTGHTHRHRRHTHGPVTVTEIGSTKDYPGTWASYVVHERGIRQVVRRVAAPDAIAWTEYTRRAVGGVWGWWSPGRLSDRCFSLDWPARPS